MYSGCDINSPRKPGPGGRGGDESKDQSSPLHLCCQWSLQSVVQTLLEHGANVNAWVNNKYITKFVIYKLNNCIHIRITTIVTIKKFIHYNFFSRISSIL